MKNKKPRFIECHHCKSKYDHFLSNCPVCGSKNEDNALERRFSNMLFLTDYKEFLLFVVGFLGLLLFSILASLGLQNFPLTEIKRNVLVNFISYMLALGVASCVVGDDYLTIISQFKETFTKYKRILIILGATAIMVGFSYAYQGILSACHVTILNNDNQTALVNMCKQWPAFSFFAIVLFAPIVEEFAYRLGLYSLLRKRNRWLAYIVTTIIFTLIHFNFTSNNLGNECLNLPNYIVPAIILAVVYEYQGINSSTFVHILNNLISFIVVMAVR